MHPIFSRRTRFGAHLALGLLLAGGLAACGGRPGARGTATPAASATAGTPAPTQTVDTSVDRMVTADGVLALPMDPQTLSFSSGGKVEAVLVQEGQSVAMGQTLARIDASALALSVADARSNQAQAAASLAKLAGGSQRETLRLELERAKNALWGQQSGRDATCGQAEHKLAPQVACDQAQASVQASEQAVKIAEQNLANFDQTKDADLAAARARSESAAAALKQAEKNVANAQLTAPFTGTITAIKIAPGVQAAPGAPAMVLAQTEPLRFMTTNLSERNVGDVTVGSPAKITLTAYPDRHLEGKVARIADQAGEDASGTVVFTVYVDVVPADFPLRAGMTGRVEITVRGGK